MFKEWGNLGKDWDPSFIDAVINLSTRPEKVQEFIDLITDNEKSNDMVQAIHFQDTFPWTYNIRDEARVEGDNPSRGHA